MRHLVPLISIIGCRYQSEVGTKCKNLQKIRSVIFLYALHLRRSHDQT